MATFKVVIKKDQQKEDGTFNVKIRVTWKRKNSYIPTEHFVSKKQLNKNFELKDRLF